MRTLALSVIILLVVSPVFSQDSPITCTAAQGTESLSVLQSMLTEIETAFDSGQDVALLLENLLTLQSSINKTRLQCAGSILSGEPQEGRASIVLDPLFIPAGIYRLTLTTSDTIYISSEQLQGDCDLLALAPSAGDAANGYQEIFESEGCQILIEVNANAPWQIIFELITAL